MLVPILIDVLSVSLVAQSCPTLCDHMDCSQPGSSVHGDSPGKNTGVGCHALLQGIFPTQGSNPGLPHCGLFTIWKTREFHINSSVQFSSVSQSCPTLSDPLNCSTPSPTPGVNSDSRPLSRWCHLAISSSVVPFSSCPQSLLASGSFPVSQLFTWGGQSIGVRYL